MSDDDDETVGYRRPPKHTRFKKGASGNPKGRAPKSRSLDAVMLRELQHMITIKVGGVTMRVTQRDAIVKTLINDALHQKPAAIKLVFEYLRDAGVAEPFGITSHEEADLERALENLAAKTARKPGDGK